MKYLGPLSHGHDHNLNLIRAVAATAVLVSHAYPIALGPVPEPLFVATGSSLGSIAVYVFFAISGFLITASFQRASSNRSFLLARTLRIVPGLFVNLVLVALVLAPIVTTLPLSAYFTSLDPYAFILRNTAMFPITYGLPGVFKDQPVTGVVGSIWTLRHEVMCYAGVFLGGVLGFWRHPAMAALALGGYVAVWFAVEIMDPALPQIVFAFLRVSFPFVIGIAFCIWRDRVPLSLVGVAICAGLAVAASGTILYFPAFALAVSYATFWLGYVPGGIIRHYNRIGDYSYGIYVYAFPLQGFAVWLLGPQTPLVNILVSLPLTLVFGILSWHLVEKPCMAQKTRLLRWIHPERAGLAS